MNRRHFFQLAGSGPFTAVLTEGQCGVSHDNVKVNHHNIGDVIRRSNPLPTDGTHSAEFFFDGNNVNIPSNKGQLIVIAARPSMGKGILLQNIVQHVAMSENIPIGYFTEGKKSLLTKRMIVTQQALWPTTENSAKDQVSRFNIIIDDTPQITLDEFHVSIEAMIRNHNIRLLAIDGFDNVYFKNATTGESTSTLLRYLNALSRRQKIPVFITIGLNRGLENRTNKRPKLTDINHYRIVEQNSDSIVSVYRDEVYDEYSEDKGRASLHIVSREGALCKTISMRFDSENSCFGGNPFCNSYGLS